MEWKRRTIECMPIINAPVLFKVTGYNSDGDYKIEKGWYSGGCIWKTDTDKIYPTAYITDWILIEGPDYD